MVRVVLDTNSSVSGRLDYGAPREVFLLAYRRRVQLWGSANSYSEFCRVVRYPRLEKRILARYLSVVSIEYEYHSLLNICKTDRIAEDLVIESDPDDEEFIRIAVSSSADVVVSRDKHLLDIDGTLGVRILRPSKFMGLWRSGEIGPGGLEPRSERRIWDVWGRADHRGR